MTRIFISYRRDDSKMAAGRIYDHLVGKFGEPNVFMDVTSIDAGDDFIEMIEKAVSSCDVLIAVIGSGWLTVTDKKGRRRLDNPNDFVRVEVSTALKRNIRVIPVLIDGAEMMSPDDLPDDLKPLTRKNAVKLETDRFRKDIVAVIDAVEKTLANKPPVPPQPDPPSNSLNLPDLPGWLPKIETESVQLAEPTQTLQYDIHVQGLFSDDIPLVKKGTVLPALIRFDLNSNLYKVLADRDLVTIYADRHDIGLLKDLPQNAAMGMPSAFAGVWVSVDTEHMLTVHFPFTTSTELFSYDLKQIK